MSHRCMDDRGNSYVEIIDMEDDILKLFFVPYKPEFGYTQLNYCPMCGYEAEIKKSYKAYDKDR